MNLGQRIAFMQAAANPFPLAASFHQVEGGGYKCKMCGAAVKDQGACADHLLSKHREMEAGGPGSGRHKENRDAWSKKSGELSKAGQRGTDLQQAIKEYMSGPKTVSFPEFLKSRTKSMEAREFSEKRRKKLAKSGDALPGGGFPIVNKDDLENAKQAIGRAKNPAAARRHINERAKELGAKPIGAQVEFSPEMRLRMPKKAGEGTTTQSPQYTGGQPELQAHGVLGMKWGVYSATGRGEGLKQKPIKVHDSKEEAQAHASKLNAPHEGKLVTPYFVRGIKKEMDAAGFHFKKISIKKGSSGCSSHGFHRGSGYESKAANMGHRLPLSAAADKPMVRQRPARPGARPRRASYSYRGEQQLI